MISRLTRWLMDAFGFSKTEANGSLILTFILLISVALPKIFIHQWPFTEKSSTAHEQSLALWQEQVKKSVAMLPSTSKTETKTPQNFFFDPNKVTSYQLENLGFEQHTIRNLLNFRRAGGSFHSKSDLKKIYGISHERVDELWDFIEIEENQKKPEEIPSRDSRKEKTDTEQPIDVNVATQEQLIALKGVGPVLSDRIIKYRDLLGGFYDLYQLEEIYGLNETALRSLQARCTIISPPRQTLWINSDSIRSLANHPYVDYNLARVIFNYRKSHGDYHDKKDLKNIKILSDSLFQKIYPYLSINP